STTASTPKPASTTPAASAAKLPPGALAFFPIEELSFRTQPVIKPETVLRRVPVTEMLVSVEPANVVIPKVGVTNQWLKVRDASNKEGYVAAWYVKYASGSQPTTTNAVASVPVAAGGVLKVKATAEGIALRKQPIVSDATLIKRLPLGTEFTVTEPNAEAKVGKNDQWLKVKDPTGTEGVVAAWFVAR
ncbi:MAG TPA: SH3 domain-containing protein, partial [Anaerolineales bacterium]|nr:SH3 domain-containing protein [Anaerolineales bacterium]